MRHGTIRLALILVGLVGADAGSAQTPPPPSASPDVTIGGEGALRQGDGTAGGARVIEGSPDVIINGRPAATTGSRTGCGGIVTSGSSSVFINGKPMAAGGGASPCPERMQ